MPCLGCKLSNLSQTSRPQIFDNLFDLINGVCSCNFIIKTKTNFNVFEYLVTNKLSRNISRSNAQKETTGLNYISVWEKNLVRSGIRTHASNWRPEHSYAFTAQAMLESGALDRSAILTVVKMTDYKVDKT